MPFSVQSTGAFSRTSSDALNNAQLAYTIMTRLGWSLEAFCGMWGNVESESGYNPWRWQNDNVLASTSSYIDVQSSHAYGLCQWDPASKYIRYGTGYSGYAPNFSDSAGSASDGEAQLAFLDANADYIATSSYPLTYSQYKVATIAGGYSVDYLTRTWFWNFERGTWDNGRIQAATYWYNVLSGYTPVNYIPIWLLFKLKERGGLGHV